MPGSPIITRYARLITAGFLTLILPGILCAQNALPPEKCGIEQYEKWQQDHFMPVERDEMFETWMARKIEERRNSRSALKTSEVVTLPVVVHVVHRGEAYGQGVNIPDEQILSQIEVLNEDYRRMNEDRINTPDDFLAVAADTEIQFVLAQRDPEGLPTNGINRVDGGQDIWELSENFRMKQLSYWPAEDYINIWVTNMGSNYLGYAQFPVSPLEGLDLGSANALSDGIVVDYMVFGSEALYPDANLIPAYNLGRTTTHEIGHYLGLRHIWGDGNCSEDDFVDDTPVAANDHGGLGLPCSYPGPNTCGLGSLDLPDMFQNYMDYTNDVCMNLFTQGQKDRMLVVLENSPRRASLLNSSGGIPPVAYTLDAGIRSIPNASGYLCNEVFIPETELRNYGLNTITSVTLRLLIDNSSVETRTFNVNLDALESAIVSFSPVTVNIPGEHEFEFLIESVNGTADQNTDNDVKAVSSILLPQTEGSLTVDFQNGIPANWTVVNPDGLIEWRTRSAFLETATNRALFMNNYEYEIEGEPDLFISPVIDLSDAAGPTLSFDLSHARYPGNDDALLITATNLCGDPIFDSDTVFYKKGVDLATMSETTTSPFFPESAADWRNETIDLSDYSGSQVRLSFIAINGYGNNLFIDNIHFDPGSVISLVSPRLVSCGPEVPLTFSIQNNFSAPVSTFDLALSIDGSPATFQVTLTPPLAQGESRNITLDPVNLADGSYLIEASVVNINNSGSDPPGNNDVSEIIYIDSSSDIVPLLQDFDANDNWLLASRDGMPAWELTGTNYDNSISIDFNSLGEDLPLQWIVSPDLDFTGVQQPYLSFEYSYIKETSRQDQLLVYISDNCGQTYEPLTAIEMETERTLPASASDWTRVILPLENLAGQSDIRIALVADSRESGRLFLDNIQLFVNEPVVFAEQIIYPNPAINGRFNITVNLKERQDARLRIMNMQGQVIEEILLQNTLNQTYPIDLSGKAQGIYLVELQGETFSLIKRVMNAY